MREEATGEDDDNDSDGDEVTMKASCISVVYRLVAASLQEDDELFNACNQQCLGTRITFYVPFCPHRRMTMSFSMPAARCVGSRSVKGRLREAGL